MDEFAIRLCDAIADALERYTEISGELQDSMPEHFAVAHIMHRLGERAYCLTMETPSSVLWQWHEDGRRRAGLEARDKSEKYVDDCGRWRCDLVLFGGDPNYKSIMNLDCLIEIKKGHISRADIEKLNTWLAHLDTCKYGLVASYCEVPKFEAYIDECRQKARALDHAWTTGRTASCKDSDGEMRNFATFAQYWSPAASLPS